MHWSKLDKIKLSASRARGVTTLPAGRCSLERRPAAELVVLSRCPAAARLPAGRCSLERKPAADNYLDMCLYVRGV
jgi:hypothetical protein